MTATKPTVVEALSNVMSDVQAVAKTERNTKQGYNFRGVDNVVNACGPVLRKHGVLFVPTVVDYDRETYKTDGGTSMVNIVVRTLWRIYGPAGDSIEAITYGEAADSGDKAMAKAQSVAYRIVLLQALCIPTDDRDVDADSHERAESPAKSVGGGAPPYATSSNPASATVRVGPVKSSDKKLRTEVGLRIIAAAATAGVTPADDYSEHNGGALITDATTDQLRVYAGQLEELAAALAAAQPLLPDADVVAS